MPIGTIIGFLVGTLICGAFIVGVNSRKRPDQPISVQIARQTMTAIGQIMIYTSIPALIGTFIEMALT